MSLSSSHSPCAFHLLTHWSSVQPQAPSALCGDPACAGINVPWGESVRLYTPALSALCATATRWHLLHHLLKFPDGVELHLATVGTCLEMQPFSLSFLAKPTSYLMFLGMASKVLMSISLSQGILGNPNQVSTIHSKHPSLYGRSLISVLSSILSGREDTHEDLAKGSAPVTLDRRGNFSDVSHARSWSGDGRNGPALPYPALTNALCSYLALHSTLSFHRF